jgi:plasmid stabilization system protein ParE
VKVRWSDKAEQDRLTVWHDIAAENPQAAARIDQRFADAAASLTDLAQRGRIGRVAGTRELLPHETYRLVYQIDGDIVWILALIHTARMWPPPSSTNPTPEDG